MTSSLVVDPIHFKIEETWFVCIANATSNVSSTLDVRSTLLEPCGYEEAARSPHDGKRSSSSRQIETIVDRSPMCW